MNQRGVCRRCGCTDFHACRTPSGPCAWTDRTRTLCTACLNLGELAAAAGSRVVDVEFTEEVACRGTSS